jgi:prepilin-type N-terminal cleavage/methylation domain-containing protein
MQVHLKNKKGYTLLELIVVIAIFSMVTSSLVMNYRGSTRAVLLNTLAHRIVSEFRQAQTYALGNVDKTSNFLPYGVFASTNNTSSIIFFGDTSKNKKYEAGELVETLRFNTGNVITKLCVNMKKDGRDPSNCTSVTELHVTYTRPYPEPTIVPTPSVAGAPYADAEIIISTGTGITKTIVVWMTGQLAIE